MNWIFKTGNYLKVDSQKNEATATLEQKLNFSGKTGEKVLLIDKIRGDWEFISIYSIKGIDIQNPDQALKKIFISLNLVKHFEKSKNIMDYIYSLSRITNYDNPIKHFTRKYSRIYETEFDAIVQDKIFVSRSILGTVLNALPREHQEAFIDYIAVEAPELLTNNIDIDRALSLLKTYLKFSIIEQAEYLKESASMLKSIISEDEYSKIGFSLNTEKERIQSVEMIKPQVEIIDEYLDDYVNLLDKAAEPKLFENRENWKFKQLFKKTRLPITLKRK